MLFHFHWLCFLYFNLNEYNYILSKEFMYKYIMHEFFICKIYDIGRNVEKFRQIRGQCEFKVYSWHNNLESVYFSYFFLK